MHHWLGIILSIILSFSSFAQERFTISGYVKDAATGEALIGANVYLQESLKGTTTNQYGFYSMTTDGGNYTIVFRYIGYNDKKVPVVLNKNIKLNAEIESAAIEVREVTITGEQSNRNVESTEMGTVQLEMEKVKSLPAFLGEVDILKIIQYLPGVQSAGEGSSGFYVRGGGPDQNLILLDEAVVYNASHLFGFFSVFNADAIKNVNLIKGGMPAQYGGRLASVLDISMDEGNYKEYHVEGGIGVIASRLTVQGPIKKDTSSFIISGRRTYIDVLMKPLISESSNIYGTGYYFYDLNTKINYILSEKDRLFLSGYFGRDVFTYRNKDSGFNVNIPWGNATGSLRWNHLFSDKMFMNASAIFSDYKFEFGAEQTEFEFRLFSGIRDWNLKTDFSFLPDIRHHVKFGGNYISHTFTPSHASARSGEVVFDFGKIVRLYAHEGAVYLQDNWDITEKLAVNAGIRYSFFVHTGPFDRYIKDLQGKNIIDTIHYDALEPVETYHGPEPRFSMKYTLTKNSSVKGSFTQNYQYIHLASISAVSLPTDLWVPSTDRVQPQLGRQYSIGYFRNMMNDTYETSVEVYYKKMHNQVEYKEGAQPEDNVNDNADNNFTFGSGESYGIEFFLNKRRGKFTGWTGYTLSWTKRKFPEINRGEEFYAKFDRRHDISTVLTYEMDKKWTFAAIFVYGTGNSVTLPINWYLLNGNIVYDYGPRNWYRMKPYHRLDLSATLQGKKTKRFESSWNFSIYNVYSRLNPYFIYFDTEGSIESGSFKNVAKQVSLFPILPSVTWNFKW
ncbi:MAG: TonB-dependent receptor [Bacteroidia bacterium]